MGRSWETIEKKNLNHNNLDQEAIDFINTIKNTSMSKSYKIPLLWAFYNNGNIKLKIDEDEIYNSFKKFYSNKENAKDLQGQKSTQGYENWGKKEYVKLAKDNPIKYLADKTSQYFYKEDDKFCLSENLQQYIHQNEFIEAFKDAILSIGYRYFKRSNSIEESLIFTCFLPLLLLFLLLSDANGFISESDFIVLLLLLLFRGR